MKKVPEFQLRSKLRPHVRTIYRQVEHIDKDMANATWALRFNAIFIFIIGAIAGGDIFTAFLALAFIGLKPIRNAMHELSKQDGMYIQ